MFYLKKLGTSYNGNLQQAMLQSIQNNVGNIVGGASNPKYANLGYYNDAQTIDKLVNGYPNCDNVIYPQIYIPFVENVNLDEQPVIVIGYDDFDDSVAPGYKVNQDGSVEVIDVDENYAQQHLVWVVSVNERIDDQAALNTNIITNKQDLNLEDGSRVMPAKLVHISQFSVASKNEKWISGKAEISFVAVHTLECTASGKLLGTFYKMKKKEAGKTINISSSNGLSYMAHGIFSIDGTQPVNCLTEGEKLHFVFYELDSEKDKWKKVFEPLSASCSNGPKLIYFAKQDAYGTSEGINNLNYSDFPISATFVVSHNFTFGGNTLQLSTAKAF